MMGQVPNLKGKIITAAFVAVAGVVGFAAIAAGFQGNGGAFTLPTDQEFTNTGRQLIATSPDGLQLVYVADNRLYLKASGNSQPAAVPGTEVRQGLTNPVFSPDGRSIAFWSGADQTFKRIPVEGGSAVTICQGVNPFGMSWGADNQIFYGHMAQSSRGIMRVSANGGTPELIVNVNNNEVAHGPQILPGGDSILFTLATIPSTPASAAEVWDNAKVVVQTLKSGERKTLIEGGADARYVQTDHIVYAKGDKLFAVPFDLAHLQVNGKPAAVLEGVRRAGATATAQYSFSTTGSMSYLPAPDVRLALVNFKGEQTDIGRIPDSVFAPRISPDSKQAVFDDSADSTIWIYGLSAGRMTKLPADGQNRFPIWSLDGQRIIFISIRGQQPPVIYWQPAAGGTAERLTETARAPEFWSAPNRLLSYITLKTDGNTADYDIWTYSFDTKKSTPLIVTPGSAQHSSRFSPDGHWIAYVSDETGRLEVFVQPYPLTGAKFQITKNGGGHPLWSPDGKYLYYDNGRQMYSLQIETQPAFKAGDPVPLPVSGFIQGAGNNRRQYDLTPDGKQFLMMFPSPLQIRTIPNWFSELKQRIN
jgi:Tol biopolymer transport system component